MNQFPKATLFIHSFQLIQAGTLTISHHPIVGTYYTGKKTKPNDALTVIMLQAFIINESNFFIQYCF